MNHQLTSTMRTTTMANQPHAAQGQRGFTLIEIMITVVIAGILAAVAIPNYMRHVDNTRRNAAQVALMDAAQFMQRFYAANNNYGVAVNGTAAALPINMQTVPAGSNGANVSYNVALRITGTGGTGFTLTATPVNAMANDRCGRMTLTQTGARTVERDTLANCWR